MEFNEERRRAKYRLAFWALFTALFTIPCVIMIKSSLQSFQIANRYQLTECAIMEFNTTTQPHFVVLMYSDSVGKIHAFIVTEDEFPTGDPVASFVNCWFDPNHPEDHTLKNDWVADSIQPAVIILFFILLECVVIVILARECFKASKIGLCARLRFRSLRDPSAALEV